MSQRAPGYRFQYQVPPTSSASSNTTVVKPALRNRCRRYRPANPAPTTATSTCCVVPPLVASERDAATIASGTPSSRAFYFAVGYSRAPGLSSGQFQSGFGLQQRKIVERTDDRVDAVSRHRVAALIQSHGLRRGNFQRRRTMRCRLGRRLQDLTGLLLAKQIRKGYADGDCRGIEECRYQETSHCLGRIDCLGRIAWVPRNGP